MAIVATDWATSSASSSLAEGVPIGLRPRSRLEPVTGKASLVERRGSARPRGRARRAAGDRPSFRARTARRPRTWPGWRPGPPSSSRSSSSAAVSIGSRARREIGPAIATELRQLIDYHNVRVYRVAGEDLVPVAFKGQVGEYVDETPEQLRIGVGVGITGWVAANGSRPVPAGRGQRPAGRDDPGDRGRARRVDAPRPDGLRRPGPRRARPVEARASTSSPTTTCGCSRSTPASRPRPSSTPTRPSSCASSRPPSSDSSATSASCSRSPSRS